MAEVFGSENHVATIPHVTAMNYSAAMLPEIGNWLIWFAKDKPKAKAKYHQLYEPFPALKDAVDRMSWAAAVELSDGACRALTADERDNPDEFLQEGARVYQRMGLTSNWVATTGRSDPGCTTIMAYPCPAGEQ